MPKNIKHIKTYILTFALVLFTLSTNAQEVRVIDNKGTIATVNNHKVTASISAPSSPNTNDIWFDTSNLITNVWDGSSWIAIVSKHRAGDIKYGIQTDDHHGWYLLDGRSVNHPKLSTNAQTVAGSFFGTSGNLPDARNRVLKHPHEDDSQNIGDIGGSPTTTLTHDNLPNVNFTGTTDPSSIDGFKVITLTKSNGNKESFQTLSSTTGPSFGSHDHNITLNSGGNDEPFERYQPYLVVNTFIYLGL
uniref:hypothetical protein n=1 Tax=uncultured Tenacibaculum sp. TaxID=174713 RepID=UPI0026144956|nr:hypothetical protein [uncultured Tenacibaculum sp.]